MTKEVAHELSNQPKMNSVRCVAPNHPKGASKAKIFSIPVQKNVLYSKKFSYKVSLCENFQRQSCKAFIGLSIRAQLVGGGCPLLSTNVTHPILKR